MDKTAAATAPKKVKLTINGKAIETDAGKTVFQAAADAGIFIPHYCYHPDLSIAGVCRMCLCDVEKTPKLSISCNTPAAEGMVVHTNSPKVKEAVKGVLELHLINHPLDCPICDKAGECKLQDFYQDYGLYKSRMDFDNKVHKPKVVDIGTIVLDSERCILCTRCVRFTSEVTQTHELGIFNRGDRSVLNTFDNGPLNNDYTGNLADICPVGALTAKDFRFQCRVWFLDKAQSTCTFCAHGCSTMVSVKPETKTLYRVEPRRNPEVNKSWICDEGRWEYNLVHEDKRLKSPQKSGNEATWHQFFAEMHEAILGKPSRWAVGLSSQLTNEEVLDAVETLGSLGIQHWFRMADEKAVADRKPYDGLLRHHDKTPNAMGMEWVFKKLGKKMLTLETISQLPKEVDNYLLLGIEGEKLKHVENWVSGLKAGFVAIHATTDLPTWSKSQWLIPATSSFEKNGTVVSALGRISKLNGAVPPQFTSRDVHGVVHGIARGNDREPLKPNRALEVFERQVLPNLGMESKYGFKKFVPQGLRLKEI